MSPKVTAAWIAVLDGIEADLEADRLLFDQQAEPTQPIEWEVPARIGPMPSELRERAMRILDQLQDSSRKLTELKDTTGQQLSAVRSIPGARNGGAVYLDVAG